LARRKPVEEHYDGAEQNQSVAKDQMMVAVRRIIKNIGLFYAAQVIGYILSFFFVMYTARYLGA